MDFPAQLEALQTNVAAARAEVQAAAAESRDRLRQRIDQVQVDVNRDVQEAAQDRTSAVRRQIRL